MRRIAFAIVLIVATGCGGSGLLGGAEWRLTNVACGEGDYPPSGATFTVRFEQEQIVTTGEGPECMVQYTSPYALSEGRLETNSSDALKVSALPPACVLEYSLGTVQLQSEPNFLRTIPDAGAYTISADGKTLMLESGIGTGADEGEPCVWTFVR